MWYGKPSPQVKRDRKFGEILVRVLVNGSLSDINNIGANHGYENNWEETHDEENGAQERVASYSGRAPLAGTQDRT